MGKTYQSQRQITGFSFLGWFAAPAVPCGGYAAEPKVNPHYGLESNLTFSRWQRPFDGHAILGDYDNYIGSALYAGCPFLSQIPI